MKTQQEKTRPHLQNHENAQKVIEWMHADNRSNPDISEAIFAVFGVTWSSARIGTYRRKRFGSSHADSSTRKSDSKVYTQDGLAAQVVGMNRVARYFNEITLDPSDMSFGDLCEYTAAFFEDLANFPSKRCNARGEKIRAPQQWWNTAKGAARIWGRAHDRCTTTRKELTESQKLAYDYCAILCEKMLVDDNSDYGIVYHKYRKWRDVFLGTRS